MNITRHKGVVRSTGSRIFVVMRQLIDDPEHCLVVYQDSLPEVFAHKVVNVVLGRGQENIDLYKVMEKEELEGGYMLTVLHKTGYLRKQNTADIDMHIGGNAKIALNVLNQSIAETQQMSDGTVKDYNPFIKPQDSDISYPESNGIVSKLLSEANHYSELAKTTYERVYSLDPTLRPTNKTTNDSDRKVLTIEIPEDCSQTKAIEIVKKVLKEYKDQK